VRIAYTISTLAGQSGCPLVSDNQVIGLHLAAGQSANIGRLITAEVIEDLEKWREVLKGDRFRIKSDRMCEHTSTNLLEKIKAI
jgi:hypothetical protein